MRKLYLAITAFAALLISQIGHAIPTIPGATDVATDDGQTYYALMEQGSTWVVQGYTADGQFTGFSTVLSANGNTISSDNARYVGLAFDGTSFYALRDDNISAINRDSYSVLGFDASGAKSSVTQLLNGAGDFVSASQVVYTGLSIADEGLFALRNDLLSPVASDSWSLVNYSTEGILNRSGNILDIEGGALASLLSFELVSSWNNSPMVYAAGEATAASVPEPATGLLLGSLFGLGFLARKRQKT